MHVEFSKELFLEKLSLVEKISGKHATLPVLQGVYLEAKGDSVMLRTTNLDVGIEVKVPAAVKKDGVVVVTGSLLVGLVSALPKGGMITLVQEEGFLRVSAERSTTRVKCLPHEEFPSLPKVEDGTTTTLLVENIVSGIKSVWYAASVSTIKPELASIYFYEDAGSLVFVATDSFRLAEKRIRPKEPITFEPLLLPIRNTVDMVRVLETLQGEITITYNQNQLSFTSDGLYFTTRLVDGSFPDYGQIIPKEFATEIIMLKADIQATLKKTTLFSTTFSQVGFLVEPDKKKITVQTQNTDVGDMTDTLEGTIEGDQIEINFNQKYLSDCFQSIVSDSVSFAFSGPGRPMIIKGISDDSFLYLVMPMNK